MTDGLMGEFHSANDITKIVERVTEYLCEIGSFVPSKDDTPEDLVKLHAALVGFSAPRDQLPDKGLAGLLKDLCTDVDGALHALLESDRSEIAGFDIERKGPSYSNSWDLPRAVEEVAIAALVDENGELPDSPVVAANTVANALLKTAGISYMRVTEGDKFGIDLRKFRDRGAMTSPAGVIVRRTSVEASS